MLNTLETLDRYNFHRADSSNSIDTLYSKIFADSTKSGGQVENFILYNYVRPKQTREVPGNYKGEREGGEI